MVEYTYDGLIYWSIYSIEEYTYNHMLEYTYGEIYIR